MQPVAAKPPLFSVFCGTPVPSTTVCHLKGWLLVLNIMHMKSNYLPGLFALCWATLAPSRLVACPVCDTDVGAQVRAGISSHFLINVVWLILPFGIFALAVAWSAGCFPRVGRCWRTRFGLLEAGPALSGGLLLGTGLGGFFDGIVFHQLLQAHNMLSARIFPSTLVAAEINMFWDGLFHLFCYVWVVAGIATLWRARIHPAPPTRAFLGSILAGVGTFNLIEGVVDHQVLALHHVVERASAPWRFACDALFLASGVLFLIWGGFSMQSAVRSAVRTNHKS